MTKTQNGIEATLFSVVMANKPGNLEGVLSALKNINIIGLKVVNNGETGTFQFVVPTEETKNATSHLNYEGFFFTTSTVYGVYLENNPGTLLRAIKPISKLGINITNLVPSVGFITPFVYLGFDDAKKALPVLRGLPVPTAITELQLVNA